MNASQSPPPESTQINTPTTLRNSEPNTTTTDEDATNNDKNNNNGVSGGVKVIPNAAACCSSESVASSSPSDTSAYTSSSSSDYDGESNEESMEDEDDTEEEEGDRPMPLLKYARITGSLPRHSNQLPLSSASPPSKPPPTSFNTPPPTNGPLITPCRCSIMGRIILPSSTLPPSSTYPLSHKQQRRMQRGTRIRLSNTNNKVDEYDSNNPWNKKELFHVAALGMDDGRIHFINPRNGRDILAGSGAASADGMELRVVGRSSNSSRSMDDVVAVSFDSGGHHLAALTSRGHVAIFQFKYGITTMEAIDAATTAASGGGMAGGGTDANNSSSSGAKPPPVKAQSVGGALDSFIIRLGGGDEPNLNAKPNNNTTTSGSAKTSEGSTPSSSTNQTPSQPTTNNGSTPILILTHPISTARFNYDDTNSNHNTTTTTKNNSNEPYDDRATCMVLDPSYHRKRSERCLIVGFSNGRVVFTKRTGHGGIVEVCDKSTTTTGGSNGGGGVMSSMGMTRTLSMGMGMSMGMGGGGSSGGGGFGESLGGALGTFLQGAGGGPKRVDRDLHQGMSIEGSGGFGIEALAWRGSLVAWADSSGIKLFDIEKMAKIARVDRPYGARASLYPNISSLRPILHFERDNKLLIAWGDCLMSMSVNVSNDSGGGPRTGGESGNNQAQQQQGQTDVVKQRTVEMGMAWELDCVACGIVPVDDEHVAVLGLVNDANDIDDDDDDSDDDDYGSYGGVGESKVDDVDNHDDGVIVNNNRYLRNNKFETMVSSNRSTNVLELQIISRSEGTATCSDILPLLIDNTTATKKTAGKGGNDPHYNANSSRKDAAGEYYLSSSFATARMDDAFEVEQSGMGEVVGDLDLGDFDSILNSVKNSIVEELGVGEGERFKDPHVNWSLDSVRYGDGGGGKNKEEDSQEITTSASATSTAATGEEKVEEEKTNELNDDSSTGSANSNDSDDYNFLFRPVVKPVRRQTTTTSNTNTQPTSPPPVATWPSLEPPIMIITSPNDTVLVQTRDVDDAISYARLGNKHGTALRHGLEHRCSIRRYRLDTLIDEYFMALLFPSSLSSSVVLPPPPPPLTISVDDNGEGGDGNLDRAVGGSSSSLTVRRLQLAAKSTPILLGVSVDMWERWTCEFTKIPGGLYVLWSHLPVRDPKLPSRVYDLVIRNMFLEIQFTLTSLSNTITNTISSHNNESTIRCNAAIDLYLQTLRSWGPVSSLKERIKIHSQPFLPSFSSSSLLLCEPNTGVDEREEMRDTRETYRIEAELALSSRMTQSAVNYLNYSDNSSSYTNSISTSRTFASNVAGSGSSDVIGFSSAVNSIHHPTSITFDALYDVSIAKKSLIALLTPPVPPSRKSDAPSPLLVLPPVRNVAMQAIAELHFMKGNYEEALRAYLTINPDRGDASEELLFRIETMAIDSIYVTKLQDELVMVPGVDNFERYRHVLVMMEAHQMHGLLLRQNFLVQSTSSSSSSSSSSSNTVITNPLIALICLVGLDLTGHFLVEHCTLPKLRHSSSTTTVHSTNSYGYSSSSPFSSSSSSALPINLLASQLESRPKLLHWFLNLLFWEKPEVYVKFPNTAVPPSAVTDLHRLHFELHVEFALDHRQSSRLVHRGSVRKRLAVVPSYEDMEVESPLMSFLKLALPHGGVRFAYVRQTLERCRSSLSSPKKERQGIRATKTTKTPPTITKYPHIFARELAHMIEWSGGSVTDDAAKATEDAKTVLNLYLEGVVSLPSAVAYAERKTTHSAMLWEILVSYCLGTTKTTTTTKTPETSGVLFGSLLEVAASSGADLAHLIVCVPPEMCIEGIRPKLVAAISDYRLKLKIHESASDVFLSDKVSLLRDQCHRARRGLRIDLPVGGDDLLGPGVSPEEVEDVDIRVVKDVERMIITNDILKRKRKQRHLLSLRKERNPGLTVRKSLMIR